MPKKGEIQQQQLLFRNNRIRQKIVKNKLILVSILNLLTFLCFVFAMTFYEWMYVKFEFQRTSLDSKVYYFWVNLLYLKQDITGSKYEHFYHVQQRICLEDVYCIAALQQFFWIGILCFSIFSIAAILQLYQVFKMMYFVIKMGAIVQTKKNFRYFITIFTYTIGLTLNAFSAYIMDNLQIKFGLSYWLCVGLLVIFVSVIVYGQLSLRKMTKQALIQNLLDQQRKVRCQKIMKKGSTSNLSNVSEVSQISQKITL